MAKSRALEDADHTKPKREGAKRDVLHRLALITRGRWENEPRGRVVPVEAEFDWNNDLPHENGPFRGFQR